MTDLAENVEDVALEGGGRAHGAWLSAHAGDDHATVRRALLTAEPAFARMKEILRKWFREQCSKEQQLAAPDYAVQCAYAAGYKRALQDVFKLVNNVTLKDLETPSDH